MNHYLKKVAVVAIFLLAINFANAQKTTYTGGLLAYENSAQGISKNIGKNVTLTFDAFYNSYTVVYTDVNGWSKKMVFVHDGSQYDQYIYNGIVFNVLMPEMTLGSAKNGSGFISFSDLRKTIYGGTHDSYKITNLKLGY